MESNKDNVKYVTKRNGNKEELNAERVKERIVNLAEGLNKEFIDFDAVVEKTIDGVYPGKF